MPRKSVKQKPADLDTILDRICANFDKASKWQRDLVMQHRPQFLGLNGDTKPTEAIPHRIKSQADLARFLNSYFKEKIALSIYPQMIVKWRNGLGLRPVPKDGKMVRPPVFPAKTDNGDWITKDCIQWMEDWIVPARTRKESAEGQVEGDFVDYEDETRRMEFEDRKRISEAMNERYVRREEAESQALSDLQLLLGIFRKAGEIDSCKVRLDWVTERWAKHLPNGELELFRAMNEASERNRTDFVETEVEKIAKSTPNQIQELAEQLAAQLTDKLVK